jgi:hypothetical protein
MEPRTHHGATGLPGNGRQGSELLLTESLKNEFLNTESLKAEYLES